MLTKKIGVDDDIGDTDAENIVAEYKDKEGKTKIFKKLKNKNNWLKILFFIMQIDREVRI